MFFPSPLQAGCYTPETEACPPAGDPDKARRDKPGAARDVGRSPDRPLSNPDCSPDPGEIELFGRARAGDGHALAVLSARLRPALLRRAQALLEPLGNSDAEDLVQETLLRLCLNLPRLRDARHFRRCAFDIVRHLALDRIKFSKNHRTEALPESFEEMGEPPGTVRDDKDSACRVSLLYAVEEMKPLTKALRQPCHEIAGWMLDQFVATGSFPTVREIAAHRQIGHGTAEEYRVRILATWRRHLDLYGLNTPQPGTPAA
jgi:DNA-directed RNA polymerase specialized sigma24 family protein